MLKHVFLLKLGILPIQLILSRFHRKSERENSVIFNKKRYSLMIEFVIDSFLIWEINRFGSYDSFSCIKYTNTTACLIKLHEPIIIFSLWTKNYENIEWYILIISNIHIRDGISRDITYRVWQKRPIQFCELSFFILFFLVQLKKVFIVFTYLCRMLMLFRRWANISTLTYSYILLIMHSKYL